MELIKVLGLIAKVKDPNTGELITLAYEPLNFNPENFGVKLQMTHLMIFVVAGALVISLLVLIICCLRKKSLLMSKRLQTAQYAQQNFTGIDMPTPTISKDDSRDDDI